MKNKRIKTIAITILTAAIFATVGIFGSPTTVNAEDTKPIELTHLNVPERKVVNLQAQNSGSFYRVGRDGVTDISEYSVPAGKIFVVTDIQTELYGNDGKGVVVFMLIGPISGGFERHIFRMSEKLDSNGLGRAVVHFTSGLMIGDGHRLRLEPREYPSGRSNIGADSRIEGYEVDAWLGN